MRIAEIDIHLEETDQVFSVYHENVLLHFNVTLLARIRKQLPKEFHLMRLTISEAEYGLTMEHRGIEEPKVAALRGKDLREPALGVLWDELSEGVPSYTMIDGHHRLVRRFRGGVRFIDMWVCFSNIWRTCLMPSTPEEDAKIAKVLPPQVTDEIMVTSEVRWKAS